MTYIKALKKQLRLFKRFPSEKALGGKNKRLLFEGSEGLKVSTSKPIFPMLQVHVGV
jgi:hypothetical protein